LTNSGIKKRKRDSLSGRVSLCTNKGGQKKMNRQVAGGLKRGEQKQPKKKELNFGSAQEAEFKELIPDVP
jgi:hypothetical protein